MQAKDNPAYKLAQQRFIGWSTQSLAGQCRMQANENLEPDYVGFMLEVADRLEQLDTDDKVDGCGCCS